MVVVVVEEDFAVVVGEGCGSGWRSLATRDAKVGSRERRDVEVGLEVDEDEEMCILGWGGAAVRGSWWPDFL